MDVRESNPDVRIPINKRSVTKPTTAPAHDPVEEPAAAPGFDLADYMEPADITAYRVREVTAELDRGGFVFLKLNGKAPVQRAWSTAPRPVREAVLSWARTGNIGVRTGRVSGVVVLDEDTAVRLEWP